MLIVSLESGPYGRRGEVTLENLSYAATAASVPLLTGRYRSLRVSLSRTRHRNLALETGIGIVAVLVLVCVTYKLRFNFAAAGFLQLVIVLGVAQRVGFWQATIASLVANVCLDYFFIPPLFTFVISDPQNWIALAVFEASALFVSRVSAEAHREAARATRNESEVQRLYEISRQLLLLDPKNAPGTQIVRLILGVFSLDAVVLFDGTTPRMDSIGSVDNALEAETRGVYLRDRELHLTGSQLWINVLRLGGRPVGALALSGIEINSLTANALASLTAIALERAQSFQREGRALAEQQVEQLRTAVLDALAHDFKTPLTAIRTASTGLIEMGNLTSVQSELAALIDSETEQLTELTTRVLQMSRLDKTEIRLRCEVVGTDDLINSAIQKVRRQLSGHEVHLEGIHHDISIRADRELVVIALAQYLDNAAKYSDPGSKITVTTEPYATEVQIGVHNSGPVIPLHERDRIFQRFFRGQMTKGRAGGSGIGLSVCKKVAEAHKGRVWARSEASKGNSFFLALPCLKETP
jgi:two-component system, OmpR family, sensor histidine kinase KdpD